MKKYLANLWSYLVKRPVFTHVGLTTDSAVKLKQIPDKPLVDTNSLIFFEVHPDLGVFEVEKIIHDKNQIKYVINHLKTHSRFIVPKKWFDFFFKETVNNLDQIGINFKQEQNHE